MFTGIITDLGTIAAIADRGGAKRLRITPKASVDGLAIGASIACSGVCLTAIAIAPSGTPPWFDVDVSTETLTRSTAGQWQVGTQINLERSLRLGDELGGHIVTGHVDGLARILTRLDEDDCARFTLEAPAELAKFIAEKGSVALDGTSLTVNRAEGNLFDIMLIPHSLGVTTWGATQPGHEVNLEVDLMARYAARLLAGRQAGAGERT